MRKLIHVVIPVLMLMSISIAVDTKARVGKIAGTVIDKESGEGIPGVSLQIVGTSMGAAASFDGSYVILNVPEGTYSILAKTIGYEAMQIDSVVVVADIVTETNFELETEEIITGPIVVIEKRKVINKFVTSTEKRKSASEISHLPVSNVSGAALRYRNGEVTYTVDGLSTSNCFGGYGSTFLNKPSTPAQAYFDQNGHHTEDYSPIFENEFNQVLDKPLSTFSIDVDAASYTNTRRFLTDGFLPPKDAVRIEEFINYFSYDYPEPDGADPFSVNMEASDCPWNLDHRLVHIGLKGKTIKSKELPPSNIVFLIDVSGSMNSPDKLPLLKNGFKMLTKQLRKKDKVAIVVYANSEGLALPSTSGGDKNKIIEAINRLRPGGSTAGAAGIQLAYQIAKDNFIKNGNNRVILATDGDFNVGVSSNAELVRIIEEKRETGIFLSVLGFGTGNLKDSRMEQLADKGNGNYSYIDNISEAKKVLVSEMGATLFTIAKDVKIQIEFNPAKVASYRLIGYENRILADKDFNDDTKDAGEIGAGHIVTALYEIVPYELEATVSDIDELKYQKAMIDKKAFENPEMMTVKLRYKQPDGDTSKLLTHTLTDNKTKLVNSSDNFRFSAAVAEFGMLLRDSKFKANATYEQVTDLARAARGDDIHGYRSEFMRLVDTASELSASIAER